MARGPYREVVDIVQSRWRRVKVTGRTQFPVEVLFRAIFGAKNDIVDINHQNRQMGHDSGH